MQFTDNIPINADPQVTHYFQGDTSVQPGSAQPAHSSGNNPPVASTVLTNATGNTAAVPAHAVQKFADWLRSYFPAIASAVEISQPGILSPAWASLMGVNHGSGMAKYFSGMGDASTQATSSSLTDLTSTVPPPSTDWGATIANIVNQVLPVYGQYQTQQAGLQTQQQLIALNITRAEQGLPPLDQTALLPAPGTATAMTSGTLLFAGLGLLGLVAVMGRKR